MIFHVAEEGETSLGPYRLIKGSRGEVRGEARREYNGGAISDGNARHVGMRSTLPHPPPPSANDSWHFLSTNLNLT